MPQTYRYVVWVDCCLSGHCYNCHAHGQRTRAVLIRTGDKKQARQWANGWREYRAEIQTVDAKTGNEIPS